MVTRAPGVANKDLKEVQNDKGSLGRFIKVSISSRLLLLLLKKKSYKKECGGGTWEVRQISRCSRLPSLCNAAPSV